MGKLEQSQHAITQWQQKRSATLQLLEVSDQDLDTLISALDSDAPLHEFAILQGDFWSADHIRELAAGLAKHPELRFLKIIGKLGDNGARIFAKLLPELPNLEQLDLSANSIGATGASAIAQASQTHPALFELGLGGNNINSPAMEDFADLITGNPRIARIDMANNNTRREDEELLTAACIESKSKNLVWVVPSTFKGCTKINSDFGKRIGRLKEEDFGDLMVSDLKNLLDGRFGIMVVNRDFHNQPFNKTREMYKKLEAYVDTLPTVDDLPELTPEALTSLAPGFDRGVLDNPKTWEALPEIIACLAAQGTPLTAEHLQQQSSRSFTHLHNAESMGYFPELVRAMNESGEQIPFDALLFNGKLSLTTLSLVVSGEISEFFRFENWEGKSPRELRECLNVLCEEPIIAERLPPLHTLKAHLAREERATARSH